MDNLVDLEFECSDDLFLQLAKLAHKRDITFNELINDLLSEIVNDRKSKNKPGE